MARKGQVKYTPKELKAKIDGYFKSCEERKRKVVFKGQVLEIPTPLTMIGLANYLDISKDTLYTWLDGGYKGEINDLEKDVEEHKTVSDLLTRAKGRIEADTLERAMTGELESKTAALVLSNMGYKAEISASVNADMTVTWAGLDPETAKKYSR